MTESKEKQKPSVLRARFAHNVRILRVKKGISQENLADICGLHRTFVSDVEREVRNVSLDNAQRIADALGIDPIELFRPIDEADAGLPKSLPKGPRGSGR